MYIHLYISMRSSRNHGSPGRPKGHGGSAGADEGAWDSVTAQRGGGVGGGVVDTNAVAIGIDSILKVFCFVLNP
jgi:hypothetical protein